ncbi:Methyltransferase domain-containing protein [Polynucleobacter meluiroseus]|uniref:Methyltransferase domain-containing protein n=1 Tax=Polynucleobacter meluiroseus TaxID=1938814 RepID=A0A240E2X9_9BURK|nr:class I SAM-dependent methyltransferase [Polynucleobacter meluiroseus]SNX29603.1 Methyltransferase domain-containing protein [Polynucleobacter meluiroseus]
MNNTLTRLVAKEVARNSNFLMMLSNRVRKRVKISSLKELDIFFQNFDKKYNPNNLSEDAIKELLGVYYSDIPFLPKDAHSSSYEEAQWNFFLSLTKNSSYNLENEGGGLDFKDIKDNFYPFNTQSSSEVGKSFIAQGFALSSMNLRPNSKILEFGPGWGNLSVSLAMMGHDVTVIEANKEFIDLIDFRVKKHGRSIRAICDDMGNYARSCTEKYDAIVFAAAFHHCREPQMMLCNLSRMLNEAGLICFSEEPIMYAKNQFLPYPWGIRLDGLSLYAIRQWGWLEYGFQYKHLQEMCVIAELKCQRIPSLNHGVADVVLAKK